MIGKTYRLVQSIQYIASDGYRLPIKWILFANGFVNVLYQLVKFEVFHFFCSLPLLLPDYGLWRERDVICVCVGKKQPQIRVGEAKVINFYRQDGYYKITISIDF